MDAAVYARISKDRAGEGLGVQRQTQSCSTKAKSLGWTVTATYTDNDVSASKDTPRPEYDRLMADIKAGTVRALVVYDLDRLTRKPAELESFITLADTYGVALANVSGDVDLTNANGRMIARIKGAVARQEAERISERVKAQKEQAAGSGMPMSARYRLFGYSRDWTVNDDEAAVVREVFERVMRGEGKYTISTDLANRGVKTTAGAPWNRGQTNRMLANHIYAGIYSYKGEVIGKTSIPALVDEATFAAVNDAMQRFGPGHNTRKYLLSGILVCDLCKTGMVGNSSGGRVRYRCNSHNGGCGKLSIKAEWVDDVVNAYMMNMAGFEVLDEEPEVVDHQAEIDALDDRIEALHAAEKAGDIDLQDLMRLLRETRAARKELIKAQSQVVERATYFEGAAEYEALSLSGKRAAIGRYFQYVYVKAQPAYGSRKFDERRLYALMRDGRVLPGLAFNVVNPLDRTYGGHGTFTPPADIEPEDGN